MSAPLVILALLLSGGYPLPELIEMAGVRNAIWRAYNTSQSFDENFHSLLGELCPESVYCPETLTSTANHPAYQDEKADVQEMIRNISTTLTGCCVPCSCDTRDCMERRSCCPGLIVDTEQSNSYKTETNMTQECVPASFSYFKNQHSGYRLGSLDVPYYMVTDCFSVNISEDVMHKCRNPNIESPEESTPVYSPSSEKNYRNMFCAECNGENDTVLWELYLLFSVRVMLTDSNIVSSVSQGLFGPHASRKNKFSELYFIPPQAMLSSQKEYSCHIPTSHEPGNTCGRTLLTGTNGTDFFTRACAVQQHPYHTPNAGYGNVFCYLCQRLVYDRKTECANDRSGRFGGGSFSALLIMPKPVSNTDDDLDLDRQTPCNCTGYSDERRNTCRQLICPPGWTFVRCHCVEFLTNVTGMTVNLYLEISIEKYTSVAHQKIGSQTDDRTATRLTSNAANVLKSRFGPISINLLTLYKEKANSETQGLKLYGAFRITFNGETDNRVLIQKMFEALDIGITVKVLTIPMQLSLGQVRALTRTENKSVAFEQSEDALPVHFELPRAMRIKPLFAVETISKLIYCKRVKLEADEASLVRNNASVLGFQNFRIPYIFFETDSSMCLDEFERSVHFGQSNASNVKGSGGMKSLLVLWFAHVLYRTATY